MDTKYPSGLYDSPSSNDQDSTQSSTPAPAPGEGSFRPSDGRETPMAPIPRIPEVPRVPIPPVPSIPGIGSSAQHTETRLGLAARRAAQLPKLRDLTRKNRQESLDDPSNNEPDIDFQYGDSDMFAQELAELYSYSERDEFIDNYRSFFVYAERKSIFHWAPLSQNVKKNFIMSLLEELELSDSDRRRNALQAMAYLLQGNFMDVVLPAGHENKKPQDPPKNQRPTSSQQDPKDQRSKGSSSENLSTDPNQREEAFVLRNIIDNSFLLYELGAWTTLCMVLALELENTPDSLKVTDPNGRRPSLSSTDCRMLRLVLACLFTIVESIRRVDEDDEEHHSSDGSPAANNRQNVAMGVFRRQRLGFPLKLTPAEKEKRIRLKESLVSELGQPINGSDQTLAIVLFDMTTKCCSGTAPHYPMRKTLLLLWKTVLTWLGGWDALKDVKTEARNRCGLPPCEDTLTVASMMQAAPPPQLPLFLGGGSAIGMGEEGGQEGGGSGLTRRPPLAKRQLACVPMDGDDSFVDDDVTNSDPVTDASTPANEQSAGTSETPASNTVNGTPMPSRCQSPEPNGQTVSTSTMTFPPKCLPWTPKIRRKDIEQFLERERFKFFGFQLPDDGTTTAGLPAPIAESMDTLKRHVYVSLSEIQIDRETSLAKYVFSQGAKEPDVSETPAEELYYSMLAQIPQYIIGLLKILLAAAPTSKAKTDAINLMAEVVPPNGGLDANAKDQGDHGLITTVDINRHKEVLVKSISALLLLLLKHFKLNHVYQFEYVSQHLVFANCIPLILKFFDQNILQYVQKANELKQLNFPSCVVEYAKLERETSPLNNNASESNAVLKSSTVIACGSDFILGTSMATNCGQQQQTEYMWRNLFSAVNLLRILNKLTKWKHARTMMLVVFKSAPVLKRSLRVKHILLQLYALKLLKMQAKYLGRQWRKTNMELMSAIYSKVRHRLNDDWAYGNETQAKPWDFQSEESALRNAVEKFNIRRYGSSLSLAIDGEPATFGQTSQPNRYRCGSPLDSNGSQTDTDGQTEREPFVFDARDPEYQPFDNYVVSVLGVRYELTDQFKFNCERWVDREVLKAKIDWDQLLKPNL